MKNRFFFTLIIAVLCVFLISASGETLRTYCVEFPHRLERNYDSYVQAFPNLEIASDNTWYDDTSELLSALKSANPPFDLFQLSISGSCLRGCAPICPEALSSRRRQAACGLP